MRIPEITTLQQATRMAISEGKPIMMDYWLDSLEKRIIIGVKDSGEKTLVRSSDEYTSPIAKVFRLDGSFIIVTENSVYLVSSEIPARKISA